MLIFNLKKEWFEKIKSGEKTHEYRKYNDYWLKRIVRHCNLDVYVYIPPMPIEFRLGYPSKQDTTKRLKAFIKRIRVIDGKDTDLKYDGKVFDIEFGLIGEKKND